MGLRRARAIMVLGTASNVGKSLVTTALCRALARRGVNVAPFKAQNMSLNSAVTHDGGEIGRAQALQAEAAQIAASVDMNPILIKPTSDVQSQVILGGKRWGNLHASDYHAANRERFWPHVVASYERLASQHDILLIEGAGSPAEINLRAGDIVNMAMAHAADAQCLLVGDIDRGGVFAAIYGTLQLLDARDRARISAWAVNKFRGDAALLAPGLTMLEERCGVPCAGVIPFIDTRGLDEEDSVPLEKRTYANVWGDRAGDGRLRIAVVALDHLANFTDFDPLAQEPGVDLRYTRLNADVARADVVILPGTKDTIADLESLRALGLDAAIVSAARERSVVGICGGMQMLGTAIHDPHAIESGGSVRGLEILDLESTFAREKTTRAVRGVAPFGGAFEGYEIHVGDTRYGAELRPFADLRHAKSGQTYRDGAVSADGRVVATYVHGLFDDDLFRHRFLDRLRERAGLMPCDRYAFVRAERSARIDALADAVESTLDLTTLLPELYAPA